MIFDNFLCLKWKQKTYSIRATYLKKLAPGPHPEKHQSGEDKLGKAPAETGDQAVTVDESLFEDLDDLDLDDEDESDPDWDPEGGDSD